MQSFVSRPPGKEICLVMKKTTESHTDKAKSTKKPSPPLGGRKQAVRLKTLADVRRWLSRIGNDLDRNIVDESKARAMTYIGSVLASVIRDSTLETRILKLENEALKNENN